MTLEIKDYHATGGTTYFLIPTYEGWDILAKCVQAIDKNVGCQEPKILIVYESKNVGTKGGGFTGACNKMMEMVLSDPTLHGVYVVGNDTEVITPDFHHEVLRYAQEHPKVGAIMFAERIPGDTVSRIPGGYETFPLERLEQREPMEICYPMLAFVWIRGETLRKVGVLDGRFSPGYYDDFDWGVRAWQSGWSTVWVPQLQFSHLRGYTMGKLYPTSGARGAEKFYEKYKWLKFGEDPQAVLKKLREWNRYVPIDLGGKLYRDTWTGMTVEKGSLDK